ncbi:HAMP domain-containing protein, partial [Streptomyces sp. NPDC056730]
MKRPAWLPTLASRRPATLRGRLLVGVIVLLAAGLVGNSTVSALTLRDYLRHRAEVTLSEAGDRVHRMLDGQPQTVNGGQLAALVEPILGITVISVDGTVAVQAGTGVPGTINELTAGRLDQTVSFTDTETLPDLIALRIPTAGLTVDTGEQRVAASAVILTMRTDIDRITVADFVSGQATTVGLTLVLGGATALLILKIGLRPLGRMADIADAIASGALDQRLPTHGKHTETARLAIAVNHAFDAQARAESNIRAFAADASHELRTPLATISGWLDLYH